VGADERPAIRLAGEDDRVLHATWSRSGRSVILTVARGSDWSGAEQVLLSPEDAARLARFLADGS